MNDHLPPPAPDWALFLDFDGTLVEIAETPDAVRVSPDLLPVLRDLFDLLGGALAVVSGRAIADIDARLGAEGFPAAGLHGLELRTRGGGPVETAVEPEMLDHFREVFGAFERENPGILMEDKGAAVTLHYRRRPELAEATARVVEDALRGQEGFHALNGKMVIEVKPDGADKGGAVRGFMAGPPFLGRTPVYLGDDVTDEHAMLAAAELGGFGVKVGEGETVARYRLDSVPAVHGWLIAAADSLRESLRSD
ncbi:trehalose-phosphatase [Lutibaculum baratangense]|uniref:Trehalose 6-phosphate phosphatase n=1 Tax=Lutibaculum baratangense AMV1 TaxID=631454 RepID=V4RI03_9HYPH|nr:trehalose-phosphatase [Lutibaculum baratangense]ESR22885.1 Trehalose-6-phosphate phosphatase [Lutibaculum baratangense AMV1]